MEDGLEGVDGRWPRRRRWRRDGGDGGMDGNGIGTWLLEWMAFGWDDGDGGGGDGVDEKWETRGQEGRWDEAREKDKKKRHGRFKERIVQGGKRNGDGRLDPSKDCRKVLLHGHASTSTWHMTRFPRWMTRAPTMAMATLLPFTRLVHPTQCKTCARFLSFSTKERSIHLCIEDATLHADAHLHLPHLSAMRCILPSFESLSTTQSFSTPCP